MVKIISIFLFFQTTYSLSQCTSEMNHQFSKVILNKINSERITHSLRPLFLHSGLTNYSKYVADSLQKIPTDTLQFRGVIVLQQNQNIPPKYYLNSDYEIIGIFTLPHQYHCLITVVTFDKFIKYTNKYLNKCPKLK